MGERISDNNTDEARLERFIAKWQGREGGQERANYALFLSQLCDMLGVSEPDPASATTEENDYVFERSVDIPNPDGTTSKGRIDLYKRGSFVLEAKQSRQKGGKKEVAGQPDLFGGEKDGKRGRRGADKSWDVLMMNARQQAQGYARALPTTHGWPPFILVCDVGHVIEVYADFSGQGKNYGQFPDRTSFRIFLEDLRDPKVRARLVKIWTDPMSLDPARETARVTREIAERLAAVSKALEKTKKYSTEEVAMFLMRCLFTMFAEDVELLPKASFEKLLVRCEREPSKFRPMVTQLWEAMDAGEFAYALETDVREFNGKFFKSHAALELGREEIGELRAAAACDWRDVDPSIFGALLEQALDPLERKKLGAHYTPRSYVERLVVATIIEPLRVDWDNVLSTAERQKSEGREKDALATVAAFHEKLCNTRILDPACGTGNFLYVSLELMKRLEGEVLEALNDLGGQEALRGLAGHTVDPHQFLGLEVNARAAAIAELVLWIGHLQWHIRTKGGLPSDPILQAFHNIQVKDAVLTWDGYPVPKIVNGKETYPNPRVPEWPQAEFIVGNPPFIGASSLRARLGDAYTGVLWSVHKWMNGSADFVMYWWDRAATLLTRKNTTLRRFGFVTTNSISQVLQRRVVERHLGAQPPVSLVMAIPDHPWTKISSDAAAVRIAMTVAEVGNSEGILREVVHESALDADSPKIEFNARRGHINSDLTVGVDASTAVPLHASDGISHDGVKLHGAGFIVSLSEAEHLGLHRRRGLEKYIRPYRNGRDLAARSREKFVIDLFGLSADDVMKRFPEVFQHLKLEVKEKISIKDGKPQYIGRDWNHRKSYRENWWVFGEPRRDMRPAIQGLSQYIATVDTARHRVFQFLSSDVVCDDKVVIIASDDAYALGILSSHVHATWALRAGGWLGAGNDPVYTKTRTFDPFPFPAVNDLQKQRIRSIAEELDAHRKRVLEEHPKLTLTGLYNILEELRKGVKPDALDAGDRQIFDDGQVLILKELHDRLNAEVAAAYGWPVDLSDEEVLARLVALNKERAAEEAKGQVRWLRPDYQIPRFGSAKEKKELDLVGGEMREGVAVPEKKQNFPIDEIAQTAAVMAALVSAGRPVEADAIAITFKQGRKVSKKVGAVLTALTRMGFVNSSDGGKTFALRKTA